MPTAEAVTRYPILSPDVERRIVAMMRAELPKAAARIAEREAADHSGQQNDLKLSDRVLRGGAGGNGD